MECNLMIISIAIIMFAVLEALNVLMLYFMPSSKMGNGVGVFDAFEESKTDPKIHALVSYLVNWVAGTKIIFILLLLVIVLTGTMLTKILAAVAMIFSVATYFWRLHPAIKQMDEAGWISPKGYSKTLGIMIISIMGVYTIALITSLIMLAAA